MKCIKNITLAFFVFFLIADSNAQSKMAKKMMAKYTAQVTSLDDEMKSKELIIVLLEENEKVLKKISKKSEKLDYYKSVISNYNSLVKELAPEYIDYFKGIKYKSVSDISKMSIEDRRNYYYLCYNKANLAQQGRSLSFYFLEEKEEDFLSQYKKMLIDKNTAWTRLEIYGVKKDDGKKKKKKKRESLEVISAVNVPNVFPTKWNMIYTLTNIKPFARMKEESQKAVSVTKDKVLLICEDDLSKKLPKENIDDYYKYGYKVVSKNDFASFIENKDSKYIYTVPTPFMMSPTNSKNAITASGIMYSNQIVDCYSGRIIGLVMNSGSVGALGASSYEKVNRKSLKKMEEFLKTYYFK